MKGILIFGIVSLVVVLLVACILTVVWWTISQGHFENVYLKPGDSYSVGERKYNLPNIKIKGKHVRKLKDDYLIQQRNLLVTLTQVLKDNNIECWISGGTLLGFVRHKTFMPWDDDCDMHTHWKNREYMFSSNFKHLLSQHNLEVFFIITASLSRAFKDGAIIRVRKKGTKLPVCDIFFVKEMEKNLFAKVDGWSKTSQTFNKSERWTREMLFPLETKVVDDIELIFPSQPKAVLKQQYGPKALTEIQARPPYVSHRFLYSSVPFLWTIKRDCKK